MTSPAPRTSWSFATAGQLVFGEGATSQLGRLLKRRRLRKALIVTDHVLVANGLCSRVENALQGEQIAHQVFDGGEPEPTLEAVDKAERQARAFAPDCLIGLGGGSNMDLAKIVATLLAHGETPQKYFGFDRVPGPVLPLVCLPTTAGTGSEVSHAAVVTDTINQIKVSTLSPYLRPALALVDPELTYSCPKQVAADSGIDALTHAIEAMTATDFDKLNVPPGEACAYEGRFPIGIGLAEQAIHLIGRHLVAAVREPNNFAAKSQMALAATLAGIAFSNCGVALVHALEYPMGGELHCSHGAGNGLLLPFVMRFNLPERKSTFARIATLLGKNVERLSEADAAEQAIVAVEELRQAINIPLRIRDIGGKRDQLPRFAEKAFGIKRLLWVNPRQASQQDLLRILETAY